MKESASANELRVVDLTPRHDESNKPQELIQISGHQSLTLNARRCITLLWHNAHIQGIDEGKDYTIEIDDLKTDSHKGYEMVEEAIEALMTTLIVVKTPNGATRRVAFLGGNDLDEPGRPAGVFHYSFDKRLVSILRDSRIWGKIALPVLMALSSKYAVSLYEHISQWTGLSFKSNHTVTLEEFRDILGVETKKYPQFGALNKHIIKPVVLEINALAPFNIHILPIKNGKRVASIMIGWEIKNHDQMKAASEELSKGKTGRKARITGTAEYVHEPLPSVSRLVRQERQSLRSESSDHS